MEMETNHFKIIFQMEQNLSNNTLPQNDTKLPVSNRFFIDERVGCIAVRDKKHPSYDPNYQGLHRDTVDVIFYAHGNKNEKGWYVDERFRRKAQQVLEHLQSLEQAL